MLSYAKLLIALVCLHAKIINFFPTTKGIWFQISNELLYSIISFWKCLFCIIFYDIPERKRFCVLSLYFKNISVLTETWNWPSKIYWKPLKICVIKLLISMVHWDTNLLEMKTENPVRIHCRTAVSSKAWK